MECNLELKSQDLNGCPAKFRYKEWAGLYTSQNSQIYVNRGLGHLGYAVESGIMPDISILNMRKKI